MYDNPIERFGSNSLNKHPSISHETSFKSIVDTGLDIAGPKNRSLSQRYFISDRPRTINYVETGEINHS